MSYRREIPKLNRENFKEWKELMKLHLGTIGDTSLHFLVNQFVAPPNPLIVDQMVDKNTHNTMMINTAPSLNYSEFDEVKDCPIAHKKWNKL